MPPHMVPVALAPKPKLSSFKGQWWSCCPPHHLLDEEAGRGLEELLGLARTQSSVYLGGAPPQQSVVLSVF